MIFLLGVAMILMGLILTTELLLLGQSGGRLSWPYGDLVPGNFLAKACQPAFVVLAALVFSGRARYSVPTTVMLVFTVFTSVATGERVNLLIRMCGGILAGLFWKPSKKYYLHRLLLSGCRLGFCGVLSQLSDTGFLNIFSHNCPLLVIADIIKQWFLGYWRSLKNHYLVLGRPT